MTDHHDSSEHTTNPVDPTSTDDLVIVNARVFDGVSAELVTGSIHVSDGRITAVVANGDASSTRNGDEADSRRAVPGPGDGAAMVDDPGAAVVDAGGNVAIPGMIDAHFHALGIALDVQAIESSPTSYIAIRATGRLSAVLARGFTTVRDVAGGDAGLARAVDEGRFASPRYLYTGPALSQTGGHGDPHPGDAHLEVGCGHMTEVVDGVDALRVAARQRLRGGAHAIKVMASGGVISPTDPIRNPQFSAEEITAVVDEATRRGTYVAAHAYSPEAITHAVVNGVRSIEHGNLLDAATAELMAAHGAMLVPTLVTYDAIDRHGEELGMSTTARAKNREVLAAGQRAIEIASEAGITIGFGTDLMGDLEHQQLRGLALQIEAQGVLATLRAATSGNASVLQRDDVGHIRPQAHADLVILDGDPFTTPEVLWSPRRTVIQAGRIVHQASLT